jgi:glycosyltransferase involved in cell wall biosynthesis
MSKERKRILLLAYDFPPYLSVGGIRPYFWYQHLHEHDVFPVVITRQWSNKNGPVLDYIAPSKSSFIEHEVNENGELFKAPYYQNFPNRLITKFGENKFVFLRKTFSFFSEFSHFFLPTGTKRSIYKVADEYLSQNKVDVIIATGDPFVLFHYANKLSKKHQIPWIADYRDPWSHYYERKKNISFSVLKWNEKRIVKNSSHITTVSEFIAAKLQSLLGKIPTTIISNGYDDQLIDKSTSIQQEKEKLTLAYAGTVYEWHPLERFFEAVFEFKNARPNFKFKIVFYGLNQVSRLQDALKLYPNLIQHIQLEPRCSNDELIPRLRKHHVMLLFNYYAYMGTKIYDYLGVNRSILLCFENDPDANKLKDSLYRINDINANQNLQADTIKKHNAGKIAQDKDDLVRILNLYADEFEENKSISCHSINTQVYSRTNQVKQLATLIKKHF